MSLHALTRRLPDRAVARQVALVSALLALTALWQHAVRAATRALVPAVPVESVLGSGLLSAVLFLSGLVLLASAYVSYRGVTVGLRRPSPPDRLGLLLAIVGPVVLVGLTAVVGTLTSVPYGALAMIQYGSVATLRPILAIAGLGVLVTVPGLLVVCQVFVQTPLREAVGGRGAVVATTLVAGVALVSDTGGLAVAPAPGRLAAVVVLALFVGGGALANARLDGERGRAFVALLVLAGGALVVTSALLDVGSLAGVAYVLARLGVLAIAASTYERADSLLPPALAYLAFSLAEFSVLLAGAGGPAPF
ncbi:hypothetical protein [Halarchaeum sp. P4]|uniref:hypothetical protein n=1 Tax=Halarchaeum sp. P4 TaxID=3421639 RepID=UPI003EBFFC74